MNLPDAHVCHQTRGRVRFKVPDRRGDAAFFQAVAERLGNCEGVLRVEPNPLTGSVLIAHETAPGTIVAFAQAHQLFRIDDNPRVTPVHTLAAERVKVLDTSLRSASSGKVDLTSVLFVSLFGLGLYQVAQGEIMVPAITLLWYAFDAVRRSPWG